MSQYTPPHLRKREEPTVNSSVESRSTGTMASLTRGNSGNSSKRGFQISLPSDEDFPTLGKQKGGIPIAPTHRYSELARSWGARQKEEKEEGEVHKKQANQRLADSQRLKADEEKERRYFNVGKINATKLLSLSSKDDGLVYNMGAEEREALEIDDADLDTTTVADDDDDDDNGYDLDADWNRRRNKNDL